MIVTMPHSALLLDQQYAPPIVPGYPVRLRICSGMYFFACAMPGRQSDGSLNAYSVRGEIALKSAWTLGAGIVDADFVRVGNRRAVQFGNGATQTIKAATTGLPTAWPITMAVYAKAGSATGMSLSLTNETQWASIGNQGSHYQLSVDGPTQIQRNLVITNSVIANKFQLVVAVITSDTERKLYVDYAQTDTQSTNADMHTPTVAYLGRRKATTNPSTGQLQWAAVWNYAMTARDVFELYQCRDLIAEVEADLGQPPAYPAGTFSVQGVGAPITGDLLA